MANEQRNTQPQGSQSNERKRADPAAISAATVEVSSLLAKFLPDEQWRVIHAAAAINGIQPPKQAGGR